MGLALTEKGPLLTPGRVPHRPTSPTRQRPPRQRLPSDGFFERAPQPSIPIHSVDQGRASEKALTSSGSYHQMTGHPHVERADGRPIGLKCTLSDYLS